MAVFFVSCYFVIEKICWVGIIAGAIGVSSNGRTRDFGSLYHGSNPCAPTTLRLYEASCGRPHEARSIGEVVSPEVLTKGDL